jgi:NADPH-dependent ferric siderophore reductase
VVCGEAGLVTGLRRQLVKDRDVDRRRILFSGYWKRGRPRR